MFAASLRVSDFISAARIIIILVSEKLLHRKHENYKENKKENNERLN